MRVVWLFKSFGGASKLLSLCLGFMGSILVFSFVSITLRFAVFVF